MKPHIFWNRGVGMWVMARGRPTALPSGIRMYMPLHEAPSIRGLQFLVVIRALIERRNSQWSRLAKLIGLVK